SSDDSAPPPRVVDYIQQKMLPDLQEIFGDGAIAAPVERWHARAWANDEWTCGGTSFITYADGATTRDAFAVRQALADHRETLPLYWAGEATALGTNPWSVHGAHQSGIDAARNVQALLDLPVPV